MLNQQDGGGSRMTSLTFLMYISSWDNYYQNDLDNQESSDNEGSQDGEDNDQDEAPKNEDDNQLDPSDLESWFDDVGAPAKTLAFLTSTSFPLSPNYDQRATQTPAETHEGDGDLTTGHPRCQPTVLDLGTGNGSALFSLRLHGGYQGRMVGVDYSKQSIELAARLWRQLSANEASSSTSAVPQSHSGDEGVAHAASDSGNLTFELLDLIQDDPESQPWWPRDQQGSAQCTTTGFDLVLDKGTFDAISLSSAVTTDPLSNTERRVCELYPAKVANMVRPGGFLLVTSCNWTEDEVVRWFTDDQLPGGPTLEVYHRIRYPVFEFGGQKGQGVASICFRRKGISENATKASSIIDS